MSADEVMLFESWAPPQARWSPWAKPVLFAHRADAMSAPETAPVALQGDWSHVPNADGTTALIVEFPGVEAVLAGLALAQRGYRPVPLFNTTPGKAAVIDAVGIIRALDAGAATLANTALSPDAPPAFLLDSDRLSTKGKPNPGRYDNRWVVFPQDFPSAQFLGASGVNQVVLVQHSVRALQDDLRDVLVRYQRDGLQILALDVQRTAPAAPLNLPRFRPWRWMRALALLTLGLSTNSAGGFGSVVPQPGTG